MIDDSDFFGTLGGFPLSNYLSLKFEADSASRRQIFYCWRPAAHPSAAGGQPAGFFIEPAIMRAPDRRNPMGVSEAHDRGQLSGPDERLPATTPPVAGMRDG
jgi:hypothetical protein